MAGFDSAKFGFQVPPFGPTKRGCTTKWASRSHTYIVYKICRIVSGRACSCSTCRTPSSNFAMSGGNVASFSLGAAAGICAAGALWWATSRQPKTTNGLAPTHAAAAVEIAGEAEEVKEAPPSEAPAETVAPEDRPADAPESCPGVSSGSVGQVHASLSPRSCCHVLLAHACALCHSSFQPEARMPARAPLALAAPISPSVHRGRPRRRILH